MVVSGQDGNSLRESGLKMPSSGVEWAKTVNLVEDVVDQVL
jgi:hypothetical protein